MSKPIPTPAYMQLGAVLDPSGVSLVFNQIDETVIPTQDLSRFLQRQQAVHYVYHFAQVLIADNTASLQWNDLSDWTAIAGNNIAIANDGQLPAADGSIDRILINITGSLAGAVAEWNTSVARRVPAVPTANVSGCWSALSGARLMGNIVPSPPWMLPLVLAPGETSIELDTDITFSAGVTLHWILELMTAPKGVMAVYPGV